MKIINGTLRYGFNVVKAKGGSLDGEKRLTYNPSTLKIGALEFPLVPIFKLSTQPNGALDVVGNDLLISIGNQYLTVNTVTFTTVAATEPDQLALFTVQGSGSSVTLTNATVQSQTIRLLVGADLTITATNFSTGAVDVQTVTPTAGQVYSLSAVSETTESGGLDNVCIREEYDFSTSPVVLPPTTVRQYAAQSLDSGPGGAYTTPESIRNYYKLVTNEYQNKYNERVVYSGEYLYDTNVKVNNFLQTPVKLVKTSVAQEDFPTVVPNLPPLTSGQIYVPTESAQYTLVADTGFYSTSTNDPIRLVAIAWNDLVSVSDYPDAGCYFTLEAGKPYVLTFKTVSGGPNITTYEVPVDGGVSPNIFITYPVYGSVFVTGPLTTYCAQYQTIDTRQTSYSIKLTVTPVN